jgi:aminomuconate-semialdehyde/2-hydroxymuconate-6-semialdehyde dehydrogenase
MSADLITAANFIGGRFAPPVSGEYFADIEPGTGKPLAEVPDSDARDIAAAVEAAKAAFPKWSRTPAAERSTVLLTLADLIQKNAEELARLESRDGGKPITLARRLDIPRAILNFQFFARAILHEETEAHPTDSTALNYTLRRPLGVAGLISPWNLPLYLLSWKVAPALAAGNCAVAKPSELTPLTAHRLAELATEAGIPPGVLNIVHGLGAKVGEALTSHPDVPLISFTGGTVTGAAVARATGPLFKRVSLELGGKNAALVFADADLDAAIPGVVRSTFENQGEICLCTSRIFVERPIFDEFRKRFLEVVGSLKVGAPGDPGTNIGALISEAHLRKVVGYIDLAGDEGGRIEAGGARVLLEGENAGGFFVQPTVITGVSPQSRVMQEEIFGPVVVLHPFDREEEVLSWANGVRYGLAACVWTQNLSRAHRVAAELEAGTVWVNTWLFRDLRVPFGGMKQSGIGREGGWESLRFYSETKNVCVKL